MGNALSQCFFIPTPEITEKNVPDQRGKVHIVTGGYVGCGLELCKILYAANAVVYVAGRSDSKAETALSTIRNHAPNSNGRVEFMHLDLADLPTVKPAVDTFNARESRLDVLTLNAGVMTPPKGSITAQGHELQIGTNCLGSFLLYRLLHPTLTRTAASSPANSVRVTWAGSLAVDVMSPKHGIDFSDTGAPRVRGPNDDYGQSKAGNFYLSTQGAREDAKAGIVHVCWNPGNLKTELQRHMPWIQAFVINTLITYPAVFGAYTELWSAVSPKVTMEQSGAFVWPWGRFGGFKADLAAGAKPAEEGGTGVAQKFWSWCEETTKAYT